MTSGPRRRRRLLDIARSQNNECYWCATGLIFSVDQVDAYSDPNTATFDHLVPKAQGGTNKRDNVVACCIACNQARSPTHSHEVGFILRRREKLIQNWRIKAEKKNGSLGNSG